MDDTRVVKATKKERNNALIGPPRQILTSIETGLELFADVQIPSLFGASARFLVDNVCRIAWPNPRRILDRRIPKPKLCKSLGNLHGVIVAKEEDGKHTSSR